MWEDFVFGEPKPWVKIALPLLRLLFQVFALIVVLYAFHAFCVKVGETFTKIDEIHKAVVKK